ncbi:MAG: alpha/beta fold hydrolase [Arenicella sp.]
MTNIQLNSTFSSPHGEIKYGSSGNGPSVVLCHGTPANSFIWQDIISALYNEFTVYYLDLPGYGQSEMSEGQDVRLRSFAQSLAAFIRHLNLDKPHLVGHDFGAATVLGSHLIEGIPAKSITIADGVILSPWGTQFSRHVKKYEKVFAAVPAYVHKAVLEAHLKTAMSTTPTDTVLDKFTQPWLSDVGQKAYYRQVGQYDYEYTDVLEPKYKNIDVPLTVLWGEKDAWVDISEGRRFCSLCENATFVTLPDAGHFSMLDTPSQFVKQLRHALLVAEDTV